MPNVQPNLSKLEHIASLQAKRVAIVDALGGLVTNNANLARRIDIPDSTTIYKGYAQIGSSDADPVWMMAKIEIVGNVYSTKWADGNDLFDNIWDNRAALTYT